MTFSLPTFKPEILSFQNLYKTPVISKPTQEEIKTIMKKYGLTYTDKDIAGYQNVLSKLFLAFQPLNDFPEPTLPVKYPRTPGYRPNKEENKYNAWYWKCNIEGTSSGKLKGKRIVLKDNIAVAGIPMMNGSKILEGYIPEFDASVVTKILDAGGHIVGKAVCEDLCLGAHSFTAATGPIANPFDCRYSAGGSSSGCAVLVATEVDMAVGGDQGGSIRAPSSWCGLVGLKPTFGLVPYTGAFTLQAYIDHLGPMAKTVYDAALLLEVIAGNDGYDHRQRDGIVVHKYTKHLSENLTGIRVGILKEGFINADSNISEIVRNAALGLKANGAIVEDLSIPIHEIANALLLPSGFLAGAKTLRSSDFRTCGFGYSETSMQQAIFQGFKCYPNEAPPTAKILLIMEDYIEKNYGNYFCSKAQNLKRVVRQDYDNALKNFDVLIMPTTKETQKKLPEAFDPSTFIEDFVKLAWEETWNTGVFNQIGHPSITVNAGFLPNTLLPVGLMIVGRHFEDGLVLQVAYAVEKNTEK